ncbi:MAG: FecR domain-containing protein, partial [Actinomycetota bacterium]|nr:FecR domain-containing protein [Actinomycetota bacterium]
MRRLFGIVVLGALAFVAGCSSGRVDPSGRLTAQGQTEVAGAGGASKAISGSVGLKSDDVVRVVDGTATITLGDGRQLSLRKGTQVKLTKVPDGSDRPILLAGELLVEAPRSSLTVNAGDSAIEVAGGA